MTSPKKTTAALKQSAISSATGKKSVEASEAPEAVLSRAPTFSKLNESDDLPVAGRLRIRAAREVFSLLERGSDGEAFASSLASCRKRSFFVAKAPDFEPNASNNGVSVPVQIPFAQEISMMRQEIYSRLLFDNFAAAFERGADVSRCVAWIGVVGRVHDTFGHYVRLRKFQSPLMTAVDAIVDDKLAILNILRNAMLETMQTPPLGGANDGEGSRVTYTQDDWAAKLRAQEEEYATKLKEKQRLMREQKEKDEMTQRLAEQERMWGPEAVAQRAVALLASAATPTPLPAFSLPPLPALPLNTGTASSIDTHPSPITITDDAPILFHPSLTTSLLPHLSVLVREVAIPSLTAHLDRATEVKVAEVNAKFEKIAELVGGAKGSSLNSETNESKDKRDKKGTESGEAKKGGKPAK
ncbi:hypothetical protein HDU93_009491 [Gonapodya sp. JEL0774]|nr:hypothetical protein HDU93_009491 [Gonapodya sp. JEL0774]